MTTSSKQRSSVKIGMLPILVLVVSLCLFTLAVLALSTAHAAATITERQSEAIAEGYKVESAGQRFVGEVDAVLFDAAQTGITSPEEAASTIQTALPEILEQLGEAYSDITVTADVTETQITANLQGSTGRRLELTLQINANLGYQVQRWSLATEQADEGTGDTLWSGM